MIRDVKILLRACLFFVLTLSVVGCGLAINNDDKVNRAEAAYADGDYRSAIIDTKDVLLDEPDNARARLILGRASIELGDAATAEKELKRAVELGTSLGDVAIDLGRALVGLGQYQQVVDDLTLDRVSNEPSKIELSLLRGDAFVGLGQSDEARNAYTYALERDNDNLRAKLGVVSSYVQEQNLSQARATLDQVLESHPEEPRVWLASGSLNQRLNDQARAETDYSRALNLATDQSNAVAEVNALTGLSQALMAQRKMDAVRDAISRLVQRAPLALATLELDARLAYIDQDWRRAQEILQEILRQAPDNHTAQLLLGSVHMQSGNLAQAEMYLSAVVAASPSNAEARRLLADTRYRLNQAQSAREIMQPMLDDEALQDTRALVMAARSSLNAGQFDHATEYLAKAVAADPDNPDPQLELAIALLMAERFSEAQEALDSVNVDGSDATQLRRDVVSVLLQARQGNVDEAMEAAQSLDASNPQNPLVLNLLGWLEFADDDLAAARNHFEAASAAAPANLMSRRYLAFVDEREGLIDAARQRYRDILDQRPDDVPSMLALARLAAAQEDHQLSRQWLEKVVEADPSNMQTRLVLGQLLLALRDFQAAREVAEAALGIDASNAAAYRLLGHAQLNLDDLSSAEASFAKAIEIDPNEPEYWRSLARVQIMRGDTDGARETVSKAYENNPDDLSLGALLATIQINNDDLDAAMEVARALQASHPASPIPLSLESEVMARDGRLKQAADIYDKVLDIDNTKQFAVRAYQMRKAAKVANKEEPLIRHLEERPLNTDVRTFLAQAYQVDGRNQDAIREYERVLRDSPENATAANNLAWMYMNEGDSRALETARRAYELAPNDGSIADTLGWILIKNGAVEEGVTKVREAARLSEDNPDVKYHLAFGLAELGQKEEAKEILNQLLASAGEFGNRAEADQLRSSLQ